MTKDSNVEAVINSIREREERGMSKYGVNTDRTDLSTLEWLQHLQEELMDGAVYIERLKKDLIGDYSYELGNQEPKHIKENTAEEYEYHYGHDTQLGHDH